MDFRSEQDVTLLLQAAGRGDEQAWARLLAMLYAELRRLAERKLATLPPGQTLQPTDLVHEAYVHLVGDEDSGWKNRRHFLFAVSRAMHDVLVERARRRASLKRGGGRKQARAENVVMAIEAPVDNMLALDEALKRLEHDDPRKHEIVLLRFFAGLTVEETAKVLDVSTRTVEREWRYIRARLHKELADAPAGTAGGINDE